MRFISIPLFFLAFAPPPPAPATQVCIYQQGLGISIGTCPAPIAGPQGPAGPAGAPGAQGAQGATGPQGPPGTSNLPPSVAASTLPQNSLGIVMADGTVIPISIVNPTSLAQNVTPPAAALAAVTPLNGVGNRPLVIPIFTTSAAFPGKPYLQANIAGWVPQNPNTILLIPK